MANTLRAAPAVAHPVLNPNPPSRPPAPSYPFAAGVPNWVRSEIEMSPSLPDPLAPSTTGDVGSVDPELASCFYLAVVEPYSSTPAGASSTWEPLSAVLPPGTPRSSRGRDRQSGGSVEAPGTPAAAPEAAGVPHRCENGGSFSLRGRRSGGGEGRCWLAAIVF